MGVPDALAKSFFSDKQNFADLFNLNSGIKSTHKNIVRKDW